MSPTSVFTPPPFQAVLHSYEADLKKPIRGLLAGELARTLLIQARLVSQGRGVGWARALSAAHPAHQALHHTPYPHTHTRPPSILRSSG